MGSRTNSSSFLLQSAKNSWERISSTVALERGSKVIVRLSIYINGFDICGNISSKPFFVWQRELMVHKERSQLIYVFHSYNRRAMPFVNINVYFSFHSMKVTYTGTSHRLRFVYHHIRHIGFFNTTILGSFYNHIRVILLPY